MEDTPWERVISGGLPRSAGDTDADGRLPRGRFPGEASACYSPDPESCSPPQAFSYCRASNSAMASAELSDGGSIAGDWTTSIVHLLSTPSALAGPARAQSPDLSRLTRQPATDTAPSRLAVGHHHNRTRQLQVPEPLGWPTSSNQQAINSSSYSTNPFPIPYPAPDDPDFVGPQAFPFPQQSRGLVTAPTTNGHESTHPGAMAEKPWEATGLLHDTANRTAWSWSTATDVNMSTRSSHLNRQGAVPSLTTPAPGDVQSTDAGNGGPPSQEAWQRGGHVQDISPLDAAGYAAPRPVAGPAAPHAPPPPVAYDSPLDVELDDRNIKTGHQPSIPAVNSELGVVQPAAGYSASQEGLEALEVASEGMQSCSPSWAPPLSHASVSAPPNYIGYESSAGQVSSYLETSSKALGHLRDSLKSWGDVVGLHAPPDTQSASRVKMVGTSRPSLSTNIGSFSPGSQKSERSPARPSSAHRLVSTPVSRHSPADGWVNASKSTGTAQRTTSSREWASQLAKEIVKEISTCPSSRDSRESLHLDVVAHSASPAPRRQLQHPMSAPRPSRHSGVESLSNQRSAVDLLVDVIRGQDHQAQQFQAPEHKKVKKVGKKKERAAASAIPGHERRYLMRCSPLKNFTRWVLAKDVTAYKAVAAAVTPAGDTIYVSIFDGRTLYTLGEEMLNTNFGWFVYMKPEEALNSYIPSRYKAVVNKFPRLILKVLVCGRGYQQGPSYSFPVIRPVDVIYPEEILPPPPPVRIDMPDLEALLQNVDSQNVLQAFRDLVV